MNLDATNQLIKDSLQQLLDVIKKSHYGYTIVLDTGHIGVLHNSVNSKELEIGEIYNFTFISSSIDKKTNKLRNFFKLN